MKDEEDLRLRHEAEAAAEAAATLAAAETEAILVVKIAEEAENVRKYQRE